MDALASACCPASLGIDHLAHDIDHGEWLDVEATTANEFMAALALALCHPDSYLLRRVAQHGDGNAWVPTTDRPSAVDALLSGLVPVAPTDSFAPQFPLRVHGEIKASQVRASLLSDLLPVPAEPIPTEALVAFRRRHGDLLPQLRRHVEARIDEILSIDDPVMQQRLYDRIVDEFGQRLTQAAAYLRETGVRKVKKSTMLRILKAVPLLSNPVGALQDIADSMISNPEFETQPLAYLAFASHELRLLTTYEIDPWTGMPLVQAMA